MYNPAKGVYVNQTICDAIHNRRVLRFAYHGHPRVVEPHAHGLNRAQNELVRCYQTGGTSRSGKVPDWRLMRVDQIESLTVTEERFADARSGYVKGDRSMSTIFCEL